MVFFEAVASAFRQRKNSAGAASRSEFWYFQLFLVILSNFFILPLDAVLFSYQFHSPISAIWFALIIRLNWTLTKRRLYDSGTNHRWGLIGIFPIIGVLVMAHSVGTILWWIALPITLGSLGYFTYLMQLKSWKRDQPRGTEKISKNQL